MPCEPRDRWLLLLYLSLLESLSFFHYVVCKTGTSVPFHSPNAADVSRCEHLGHIYIKREERMLLQFTHISSQSQPKTGSR